VTTQFIATAPKLSKLHLSSVGMVTKCFPILQPALSASRNLQLLDLSCNKIEPADAVVLFHALTGSKVQTLLLADNKVGNAGRREY